MIEVKNISKSFDNKLIIDSFSAVFEQGKTNLIIGASGSGKTVLTKCIVGLFKPDSGEVLYDGRNFTKMTKKEKKQIRKEIGMLFQGAALFDSMTVEENVKFPLMMFSDMSEEEMKDRINFSLKRVNMENTNKLYPEELSGGMKKRVGIARAIVMKPKYLFCDEPNSGLDPQTAIVIDNLIQEITYEYNITTIVITHDMNSVMGVGDKVFFIYNGKKWWQGSKNDILDTDNPELCDFIFASEIMKKLKKI